MSSHVDTFFHTFSEYADAVWLTLQIASVRNISLSGLLGVDAPDEVKSELVVKDHFKEPNPDITQTIPVVPPVDAQVVKPLIDNTNKLSTFFYQPSASSYATMAPIPKLDFSKLQFHRAIKPLKKWVPSAVVPQQIDIEATLNQLLKNHIAIDTFANEAENEEISIRSSPPIFSLGKERWLELVLVVDESTPMRFFNDQLQMTFQAFEESGIFRNIQIYYINEKDRKLTDGYPRPDLYKRNYLNQPKYPSKISDLITPSGKRVVLFLSSCTSKMWHDWTILENDENGPTVGKIIHDVSKHHPVAILQMLPERLWLRSGISYFEYCKAWATTAVTPNTKLSLSVPGKAGGGFAIPVLSFDTQRILAWARMVSGKTNSPVLSMFIPDKYTYRQRDRKSFDMNNELHDRIDLFLNTAPKQARQFAGYLSVMLDLTETQLKEAGNDLFPESESDLITDMSATGLLEPKGDLQESEEIKFGLSDSMESRIPFWESIPHPKRLEGMAYYYEFIAKPESKFYDNDGEQVNFWAYLDDRESNSKGIGPLEDDLAGKEMFDLFETILNWAEGLSEITTNGWVNKNKDEDVENQEVDELVDTSTYHTNSVRFEVETKEDNESEFEANSKIKKTTISNVETFDFSRARAITEQNDAYLSLPLMNIGLWGETGVGKTSFLMSMSRDLVMKKDRKFTLNIVDHYGNFSQHPNTFSRPKELESPEGHHATRKMTDHLMVLNGTVSNASVQKLFCFHDFPGNDTTSLTEAVDVTYRNCDALFLFFAAEKIMSPSPRDKSELTRSLSDLLNLLQNKRLGTNLRYMILIITKSEINTASILVNANDPWDFMHTYLDRGILQSLQNRITQTFVTSSLGKSRNDWIPQNTALPLLWFWDQENRNS